MTHDVLTMMSRRGWCHDTRGHSLDNGPVTWTTLMVLTHLIKWSQTHQDIWSEKERTLNAPLPPRFKAALFMARLHLPAIKDLLKGLQSFGVAKRAWARLQLMRAKPFRYLYCPQCLIPWTMSLGKAPEAEHIFSVGHHSEDISYTRCCDHQAGIRAADPGLGTLGDVSTRAWHHGWWGQCATDSELGHKCCGHQHHHGVASDHKHQVSLLVTSIMSSSSSHWGLQQPWNHFMPNKHCDKIDSSYLS